MIIIFGAALINIQLGLNKDMPRPNIHVAHDYNIGIGGKAAIQALAAARVAEKSTLVSHIGDDHYGKNIMLRLRQNGVVTSGVARHNIASTGSIINIGKKQTIVAPGASTHTNHEQVPEEILDEKTILLIQDEFPAEQNLPLIEKAKELGATIILNCGMRDDVENYDLSLLDYVITDEINTDHSAYVSSGAKEKLITLHQKGACSHNTKDGKNIFIETPEIEGVGWVDASFSEDAFCGTFAACLHQKRPMNEALRRASYACALTAGKKGDYHSMPYLDDLKEALKG